MNKQIRDHLTDQEFQFFTDKLSSQVSSVDLDEHTGRITSIQFGEYEVPTSYLRKFVRFIMGVN